MSLRKQLTDALISLLPVDPKNAIKGTELIKLVKLKIDGDYSDASLRYHFSIMSCDPASPIAKVDKGQGYYRRTAPVPALANAQQLLSMTQGRLDELGSDGSNIDLALLRMKKFRAVVSMWCDQTGKFPFVYREPFTEGSSVGNLWKFPEMTLLDWENGLDGETESSSLMRIKSQIGLPPFRMHNVRLRIIPSHHSFREDIFQTLSAATWAQGAELFYANPILDEALTQEIARLHARFGVGVTTFGLTSETIDELPSPAEILNAQPKEVDAIMDKLDVIRITFPETKPHINWQAIDSIRHDSKEIEMLFNWIEKSLNEGTASPFLESN